MESKPHSIRITNGNLYIDKNVYSTYFQNIESVVLLYKPPMVLMMPVQLAGNGGMLLKIRNARGDRVLSIIEFIENSHLNILDSTFPVIWSTSDAALTFELSDEHINREPN